MKVYIISIIVSSITIYKFNITLETVETVDDAIKMNKTILIQKGTSRLPLFKSKYEYALPYIKLVPKIDTEILGNHDLVTVESKASAIGKSF